jgi:hypothetical protein
MKIVMTAADLKGHPAAASTTFPQINRFAPPCSGIREVYQNRKEEENALVFFDWP